MSLNKLVRVFSPDVVENYSLQYKDDPNKNDIVIGVCTIDADPVVATFTELPPTKLDFILSNDALGIETVFQQ